MEHLPEGGESMENNKLLASVAVFKSLYDREENVYKALSIFLAETISSAGLSNVTFTSLKATEELNKGYGFSLPEAVVKEALSLLPVKKTAAGYTLTGSLDEQLGEFREKYDGNKGDNEALLAGLFAYVTEHIERELTEEEKECMEQDFFALLLDSDEGGGEFGSYISAYIIRMGADPVCKQKLDSMRQGNLLYTGLRYDMATGNLKKWDRKLYLFLETDVLFYAAGIAGERYQQLFGEFFRYLREMNARLRSKNMPEIQLCYFKEVETEINDFFGRAEKILRTHAIVDPAKVAMVNLLEGCTSPSDIQQKRSRFDKSLRERRIICYPQHDYYGDQKLWEYNLESQECVDNHSDELEGDYQYDRFKRLNYIHILRKGQNRRPFEQIGFITVTCNSSIRSMDHYKELQEKGMRRTVNLDYVINRFWFALNKGFGENKEWPITIDIVSKAQSLLAGQMNRSISSCYESLKKQYTANEISKEELYDHLDSLRQEVKMPEHINEESLESSLTVAAQDYEEFLLQRDFEKKKRREETERAVCLEQENAQMRREMEEREEQYTRREAEQTAVFAQLLADKEMAVTRQKETEDQLKVMQQQVDQVTKTLADFEKKREADMKRSRNRMLLMAVAILFLVALVCYLIWGSELITWLFAASGVIVSALGIFGDIHSGIEAARHLLGEKKKKC